MSDIAFHAEFKADGGVGPSGPGDTLRLVHALRSSPPAKILTIGDDKMLKGLLDGPEVIVMNATATEQMSGSVCPDVLAQILDPYVNSGDRVLHAFIGREGSYPWLAEALKIGDKELSRMRVDSSFPKMEWMFHGRWVSPDTYRTDRLMLAVPVRRISTRPESNTPSWFPQLVTEVAHSRGWGVMWLGGSDGPPSDVNLEDSDEYLAYGGKSLLEQIEEVRARASAAVGWNSGGLVIAAAAGIPVLRVGEFQKFGPIAQPRLVRDFKWGAGYNSYLATATTVGLAPAEIEADRFPRDLLRDSLDFFLSTDKRLSEAKHVILPPGVVLNEENFKNSEYEISWPPNKAASNCC